jgi:competence protein ComGC
MCEQHLSFARRIWVVANRKAFTLIELLVLVATLFLLVCVLIPSLARQRHHARVQACLDNLKQINVAFRVWPTDGDRYPAQIGLQSGGAKEEIERGHVFFNFLVMSNELSTPRILVCPEDDGKRAATNFNSRFNDANVSYFVSPDARDVYPQMLLAGDRNLEFENKTLEPGVFVWTSNMSALRWTRAIHNSCGNVGLADGSVHFCDSSKLAAALRGQECGTNRLAIP